MKDLRAKNSRPYALLQSWQQGRRGVYMYLYIAPDSDTTMVCRSLYCGDLDHRPDDLVAPR